MKSINNLENLSPDLYLRYHYGFEIIKNLQKSKPCHILDVGGRSGIMGDFIKKENLPYTLTIIDSLPDDKSKTTVCDKYIQKDLLKFETTTKFNYLVTFDVLEHVNDKKLFINKCLSLCDSLILSAPFKSDITDIAENIVDQYFLKYKGVHHPWLKEHFKQGLPEITWLKDLLNSHKITFEALESNNIENWVNFMLPNLLPALYTVDTKKLDEINQYYNQNFQDLGDTTFPTYRKIFVTLPKSTKSIPNEFIHQNSKINIQKKIIFINLVIDFLTNNIKLEKENNILKDTIINEKLKLEKEIKTTKLEIDNYTKLIDQIINSKFYKIWQLFCNCKKYLTNEN